MKRRDWLRGAITTPALAVAATPAAALAQTPPPTNQDTPKLQFSPADAVAHGTPAFFTPSEFAALESLAGTLVPAFNGRPGAIEAGVPRFLDFLLAQSPADRQSLYRTGLQALAKLSPDQAKQALAELQRPWTFVGPLDPLSRFLRAAKDDILQATINSREWASSGRSRTAGGTSYYYFPIE